MYNFTIFVMNCPDGTLFLCVTAGTAKHTLAIVILSVCPSVCHDPLPIQAQVR